MAQNVNGKRTVTIAANYQHRPHSTHELRHQLELDA